MSDVMVLYHNPLSRSRIAHWMLEECGANYEVRLLSLEQGDHKAAAFLAINPMGKVPALVHRGEVITETAAICAWLADEYAAAGLAPAPGGPGRGAYLRWLFFAAACVEPAIVDRMMTRPEVERRATLGYGSYDDVFGTLAGVLRSAPYLTGPRFTAADLYLASQLAWGSRVEAVPEEPWLADYIARCTDRVAYRRCMVQGEAMAQQLRTRST